MRPACFSSECPLLPGSDKVSDQSAARRDGPVSTASASKALILLSSLTSRISSSCAGRSGFSFAEEPPDYPAIEPDTRELENILSHRSLWLSFLNVEWRLLAISPAR